MIKPSSACPCSSGKPYRECCRPFHLGEKYPDDCPTLVRSRFAAFALKQVDYLWRTLHPRHPDRARPEEEVLRELRVACTRFKYTRLTLWDDRVESNEEGTVLFLAEVYETGKERSFAELSGFRRDAGQWRYLTGHSEPNGPALSRVISGWNSTPA